MIVWPKEPESDEEKCKKMSEDSGKKKKEREMTYDWYLGQGGGDYCFKLLKDCHVKMGRDLWRKAGINYEVWKCGMNWLQNSTATWLIV